MPATAQPPAPTLAYGLPTSPQARKVLPLIPQLLAEGWTAAKLAQKAGIGERTAKGYLTTIQHNLAQKVETDTSTLRQDAVAVAQRIQAAKVARSERLEGMIEALLDRIADGFTKTAYDSKAGAFVHERQSYDAASEAKILLDILRADATQAELLKELSGRGLAEKLILARTKGEAIGAGIGSALIDATAAEVTGILEAELVDPDALAVDAEAASGD